MCVLLDDEMTTKSLGHGNYSPLFFQKSAQIGRYGIVYHRKTPSKQSIDSSGNDTLTITNPLLGSYELGGGF